MWRLANRKSNPSKERYARVQRREVEEARREGEERRGSGEGKRMGECGERERYFGVHKVTRTFTAP